MSFLNTIVCGDRAEDLLDRGLLRRDMFIAIAAEHAEVTPHVGSGSWSKLARVHLSLNDNGPVRFEFDQVADGYLLVVETLGPAAIWLSESSNLCRLPVRAQPSTRQIDVYKDMAFMLG